MLLASPATWISQKASTMRTRIRTTGVLTSLALALAIGTSCAAQAQIRPDAGQTLRELESMQPERPPQAPAPPLFPAQPALAPSGAADNVKVPALQAFRVTGAENVAPEELQALLLPWLGRELTVGELKQAANSITQLYRERGYMLARAYIPEQTIQDNTAEIAILEGRLGGLLLKNSTSISDERLRAVGASVEPGASIKEAALERGLLLLQDLPGVAAVEAALQPGQEVGDSDLVVAVKPAPPISGIVDADNHGNRFTGQYRLGVSVNLNSMLGMGEQFSARIQASNEKLYYGRLSYRMPLGSDGLMAGAALATSHYELGEQFSALDASGRAHVASLFASYPFIRSRNFNFSGGLSLEAKNLHDQIDIIDLSSKKRSQQLRALLTANGFVGQAGYGMSLSLASGRLDIRSPAERQEDSIGARTHGQFTKLAYSLNGNLPLSGPWSLSAFMSGQFASRNLDSSEKFFLGGANGVRAYPQGEGVGDEGHLFTTELRYALPPDRSGQLTLGGFLDYGTVKLNRNPYATGDNRRNLSGLGVSAHWITQDKFQLRASLAHKLGSEPALADRDRDWVFWMQGMFAF